MEPLKEPLQEISERLGDIQNKINRSPHSKAFFGRVYKWYKYREHKEQIQKIVNDLSQEMMDNLKTELSRDPKNLSQNIHTLAQNKELLLQKIYGNSTLQAQIQEIGKWAFMGHSRTIEKQEEKMIQMMTKLDEFSVKLDHYHEKYQDKLQATQPESIKIMEEDGFVAPKDEVEVLSLYFQEVRFLLSEFDQEFEKEDLIIDHFTENFKKIFQHSFQKDMAKVLQRVSDELKTVIENESQMLRPEEGGQKQLIVKKTKVLETKQERLDNWDGMEEVTEYHEVYDKPQNISITTHQQAVSPEEFIRQQDLKVLDNGNDYDKLLIHAPLERFQKLYALYQSVQEVINQVQDITVDQESDLTVFQHVGQVQESLLQYFSQIESRHKEYQSHLIKQLTPSNYHEIEGKIESLNQQFAHVYSTAGKISGRKIPMPDFSSVLFEEMKVRQQEFLGGKEGLVAHGEHLRTLIQYIIDNPDRFTNVQIIGLLGHTTEYFQEYRIEIIHQIFQLGGI